jgi:hypothetical protein
MLSILLHFRTEWNYYFTGNPTPLQQNDYTSRQTPSSTSVHVLNCLFRSITSDSYGGALYCTSVTYLLVESSSFFSCKMSNQYGGAIYFSNSGGECVLHEVCGYDCYSTYSDSSSWSWGQFSHTVVSNGASSKNYVNYSSIVRCLNERTNAVRTLSLINGKICLPSVNVSMNKCYYRSGIYCQPFSDSSSVTCSLSYSTFADNIATYYICILFATSGAKYEIKSCNIIRNIQVSSHSCGTICTPGDLMIEYSCILENIAPNIFSQQSSSKTITLSNCIVGNSTFSGSYKVISTVTKSFILALNHMSTRNCHAEYDSIGHITPITTHTTSSKKKIHLCTCGRFFYQLPPQTFFVSFYLSL